MIEILGKYNKAVCYTGKLDDRAYAQLKAVCDREEFADSKIRIMPDVHYGKGCTVGTTLTVNKKVVPAMVGVDIGCGMETVKLADKTLDLERLDAVIRENIPSGRDIREKAHCLSDEAELDKLYCLGNIKFERALKSIGTLGGGNHFIEVDRDEEGSLYLVIHSGSRHLGCEVAEYYQAEGYRELYGGGKRQIAETIARLKAERRFTEIETTIRKLKLEKPVALPYELVYVEGRLFDEYIHDMKIVQRFAALNRLAMTDVIIREMGLTELERFTTVHNYIDTDEMILRKGAVAAHKGQKLLIPMNMRDGALVCIGKGNAEWNYSAPHGAGRLMSRTDAFDRLFLEDYREQMKGIYSTCVRLDTLDESPMAYKPIDEIVEQITPTVEIACRIKPIYNFKASN